MTRAPVKMILPPVAVMCLLALIVVLLARTARMDEGSMAGHLYVLKADHATLANTALRVRQGHAEEMSGLVTTMERIRQTAARLTPENWPKLSGDAKLWKLLGDYQAAVAALAADVERFKTANSVLNNSLRYLPELAEGVLRESPEAEGGRPVRRQLWSIARHVIEDSAESRSEVEQSLKELDTALAGADDDSSPTRLFRLHVAKVLETQPQVANHLEAIVTSTADQRLTSALSAVADRQRHLVERQQLLQAGLFIGGATLIGYVGALLWLLRLSVDELNQANLKLEDTVQQRVSELKVKNQQLFQAQKLESIGQLAAGIAHEINTPMQFVYDNLEFLNECSDKLFTVVEAYDRNLSASGPHRTWQERSDEVARIAAQSRFDVIREETPKAIRESLEGIQRVIHIVRAMKEFAHPGQEALVGIDLNNAVHTTVTITRNRWKNVAEIQLELDRDLPTLRCVPAEVNQLLLNLIVNASDAVAEKYAASNHSQLGRIGVTTRREPKWIVIEISDDGCGIPEHIRGRIFDPFFTTKDPGKGTGQGLSICYNIAVKKMGGSIEVESALGEGTRFIVKIPNPASADPPENAQPSDAPQSLEPALCV